MTTRKRFIIAGALAAGMALVPTHGFATVLSACVHGCLQNALQQALQCTTLSCLESVKSVLYGCLNAC